MRNPFIFITMFSDFEWYLLLSYGYPVVSLIHGLKKKENYEKELILEEIAENKVAEYVNIHSKEIKMDIPMYVGNQHAHIPVGGGMRTEWESVGSGMIIPKNGYDSKYVGYYPVNDAYYKNTRYANNMREIGAIIDKYKLQHYFPVTLPMKMNNYAIPGKATIFLHKRTGLFHTEQGRLLNAIMWRKRLPGTVFIPLFATAILLGKSIARKN